MYMCSYGPFKFDIYHLGIELKIILCYYQSGSKDETSQGAEIR